MIYILFGVSLTLNILIILGIYFYKKIRSVSLKKFTKNLENSVFYTDKEIDDALSKW